MLVDTDLRLIPPFAGVRLLPLPAEAGATTHTVVAAAEGRDGRLSALAQEVTADDTRTIVAYEARQTLQPSHVRVIAAAEDQRYADAILRAVLREGVWHADEDRRIDLVFSGAPVPVAGPLMTAWMQRVVEQNTGIGGGERDGTLVVHVNVRPTEDRAATVVANVLRSAFAPSFAAFEPRRISPSTIARWSRPMGAAPANVLPQDEGDRRWFWLMALTLLGVEHAMRRRRPGRSDAGAAAPATEDVRRVA
jgi:hypothetical protein